MLGRVSLERWLIAAFSTLLILSFVTAILVLWLGFPISASPSEVSARGQISQALSTVFALALGLIAILIALRVESASYKASQEARNWLARLTSTLLDMLRVSAFSSTRKNSVVDLEFFASRLLELETSEAALAINSWISSIEPEIKNEKRPKNWRIFIYNIQNLRMETNVAKIGDACCDLLNLLSTLSKSDIKAIASRVHNLDETLGSLPKLMEHDSIIQAMLKINNDKLSDRALAELFRFIKSKGIEDPDVELMIAATGEIDDPASAKKALMAGANPNLTQGEIMSRYHNIVQEFRNFRT